MQESGRRLAESGDWDAVISLIDHTESRRRRVPEVYLRQSLLKAAKAFEVRRVRPTAVAVRDRVVEIAVHRGLVATWEPARQVAPTDKIRNGLRRRVAALRRRIGGMNQWT
jgi:hypothetical protein